jgi:hypothetical protein
MIREWYIFPKLDDCKTHDSFASLQLQGSHKIFKMCILPPFIKTELPHQKCPAH